MSPHPVSSAEAEAQGPNNAARHPNKPTLSPSPQRCLILLPMYTHRYTPQAWERNVLAAQMEIFIKLTAKVDFITHLNTARMMLRGLETAARRLVLVLALMAPRLKPIAPKPMSRAEAGRLAAPSGLRMPSRRFRLIEPMPMIVGLKHACTRDDGPPMTRIALTSLGLGATLRTPNPHARAL